MTPRNARLEKVLALIPAMDKAGIGQLEQNVTARPEHPDSATILAAIAVERERRPPVLVRTARVARAPVAQVVPTAPEGIGALPLEARIERALRDLPPSAAELRRLLLLHAHPGLNENELATLAGDNGPGGFSLTIGGLCRNRRAWLPEPELVLARNAPFWSGLLCDLTPRTEPDGRVTHEWRLSAATVVALRRLGHLPDA
jgi:hypothetical protein